MYIIFTQEENQQFSSLYKKREKVNWTLYITKFCLFHLNSDGKEGGTASLKMFLYLCRSLSILSMLVQTSAELHLPVTNLIFSHAFRAAPMSPWHTKRRKMLMQCKYGTMKQQTWLLFPAPLVPLCPSGSRKSALLGICEFFRQCHTERNWTLSTESILNATNNLQYILCVVGCFFTSWIIMIISLLCPPSPSLFLSPTVSLKHP